MPTLREHSESIQLQLSVPPGQPVCNAIGRDIIAQEGGRYFDPDWVVAFQDFISVANRNLG